MEIRMERAINQSRWHQVINLINRGVRLPPSMTIDDAARLVVGLQSIIEHPASMRQACNNRMVSDEIAINLIGQRESGQALARMLDAANVTMLDLSVCVGE